MSKRDLSPDSLEAQADALLAAADSMDIPDEIPMPGTRRFPFPAKMKKRGRPPLITMPPMSPRMRRPRRPASSAWMTSRWPPFPPPAG